MPKFLKKMELTFIVYNVTMVFTLWNFVDNIIWPSYTQQCYIQISKNRYYCNRSISITSSYLRYLWYNKIDLSILITALGNIYLKDIFLIELIYTIPNKK